MSAGSKARFRFQYSLKTFLIVSCALGVFAGVMGRLLLHDPQTFLQVSNSLVFAGPFLLAIGTILWIGLRGRRRGLMIWGGTLAGMQVLGLAVLGLVTQVLGPPPYYLALQSNQQVLQTRLPGHVSEPWVWSELERRLRAGSLSQEDADDAIRKLTADITASRLKTGSAPDLAWSKGFLGAAAQAGMISEPVAIALCDAFYGTTPVLKTTFYSRQGQRVSFGIDVKFGNPFDFNQVPWQLLWQVNRVLLDGQPITVRQNPRFSDQWSGSYDGSLKTGNHAVTVELECAYVDRNKLPATNLADSLPVNRWPAARKRWKQSVSGPLVVP
jgi:hypothetical protein